jgi:hypothetical protein
MVRRDHRHGPRPTPPNAAEAEVEAKLHELLGTYQIGRARLEAVVRSNRQASYDELCDLVDDMILGDEDYTPSYDYGDEAEAPQAEEVRQERVEPVIGSKIYVFGDVLLDSFKTTKCKRKAAHNSYECKGYHGVLERRRKLTTSEYSIVPCAAVFQGGVFLDPMNCYFKQACENAHTKNEVFYHPLFFRTKECGESNCPRLLACPFIHSAAQPTEEQRAEEMKQKAEETEQKAEETKVEQEEAKQEGRRKSLCLYCTLKLTHKVNTGGRCTCQEKNRSEKGS